MNCIMICVAITLTTGSPALDRLLDYAERTGRIGLADPCVPRNSSMTALKAKMAGIFLAGQIQEFTESSVPEEQLAIAKRIVGLIFYCEQKLTMLGGMLANRTIVECPIKEEVEILPFLFDEAFWEWDKDVALLELKVKLRGH